MERSQRTRVPSAKAAENAPKVEPKVDVGPQPMVTPEWKGLPTDPAYYEPAREIAKGDPVKFVSKSTGEVIELYRLGPQ